MSDPPRRPSFGINSVSTTSSTTATPTFTPPTPPISKVTPESISNSVLKVNRKQKDNPVLRFVTHIPYEFCDDVAPDFIFGQSSCALFLSIRYSMLNPEYIVRRIRGVNKAVRSNGIPWNFSVKILLVETDIPDFDDQLLNLYRTTINAGFTIICAFNKAEAGRYIELFKHLEEGGAKMLEENLTSLTFLPRAQEVLSTIPGVNKTDTIQLLQNFGSIGEIFKGSSSALQRVPGIGQKKANRIYTFCSKPFLSNENPDE